MIRLANSLGLLCPCKGKWVASTRPQAIIPKNAFEFRPPGVSHQKTSSFNLPISRTGGPQNKYEKLIDSSPLKVSFTNKMMTAYRGFSLLSRLFERLNLKSEVEAMLPFTEVSPNSMGVYSKILKLGLTVAAGGYRYTHAAFLGDSTEIYEQAFGLEKIPKSITAVTRFFNRFKSWQSTEFFADRLWRFLFERVIPLKSLGEEVLSFDSTVVTRYGNQEGAKKGYNPKKRGRKSHHPIFAFLNRSRYVVNLWNRSGDSSSSNRIVEFCKQTLERLSGVLNIRMALADSGYYQSEFFDYLEEIQLD